MTTVPIRWYRPGRDDRAPTLLWLHGGGFFRGSIDQPEAHDVARALARRGLTVATAGYRLAPIPGTAWLRPRADTTRGRFPIPLDDVLTALRRVSDALPGGVVIGGASAGACLAAGATLRAMDAGIPPVGTVLAYGFFHAEHPRHGDGRQRSRGHRRITHAPRALDIANRNYAGSRAALSDRFAFPGGHDLAGFPPTLSINAEHDNMRASGDRFAAELRDAAVDVEHRVLPGTDHAFLNRPGQRAFVDAVDEIAAWTGSDRFTTRA